MLRGRGLRYIDRLSDTHHSTAPSAKNATHIRDPSHVPWVYVELPPVSLQPRLSLRPWRRRPSKAQRAWCRFTALGMGVKPRHGANVVLGCAIVVEHALDHGVHCLPLMPRYLLLAVHQHDLGLILLNHQGDSRKNEDGGRPQANWLTRKHVAGWPENTAHTLWRPELDPSPQDLHTEKEFPMGRGSRMRSFSSPIYSQSCNRSFGDPRGSRHCSIHNDAAIPADTIVRPIYTHGAQERSSPKSIVHFQHESCPTTMLKSLILGLFQASGTLATWSAYQEYVQSHNTSVRTHQSNRPSLVYSPQRPYKKMHSSPKRDRKCVVKSHNDFKTDDSSYVLQAVKKCNNGGHVLFPEGTTYVIGAALDLTGLKHIDIGEFLEQPAADGLESTNTNQKDTSLTHDLYDQTSKVTSNLPTIRTIGKLTPSTRLSKTPPPFSSLVVKM
jgi:hypothetical protein